MKDYLALQVEAFPNSHGHEQGRGQYWHSHVDGGEPHTHDDGYCPRREDKTHCEHWWDGEPCCTCRHNGGTVDE